MLGDLATLNYLREVELQAATRRRRAERDAAIAADQREYDLSPESQAALDRGDLQIETGVYEGRLWTCKCDGVSEPDVDTCYRCEN